MLTDFAKRRIIGSVAAAIVMTVAGTGIARTGFARIVFNTIDPVAVVADNGRRLVVTGPIECTAGERAWVRVTVTQRSTGAVAEGQTHLNCTGDIQQWEVNASTQGKATFEDDAATAVALGFTSDRGDITDVHQWLVAVTLVRE